MPPTTTTRLATAADLPRVCQMAHALAEHHQDAPTLTLDMLRRDALGEVPWVRIIVACRGESVVGYAALCPLVQLHFGVRGMDMHHLFVAQEARGQGVGRALIMASLAQAKAEGCRYVGVGTHPDNHAAQQVYLNAGFESRPAGPRFRIKI